MAYLSAEDNFKEAVDDLSRGAIIYCVTYLIQNGTLLLLFLHNNEI